MGHKRGVTGDARQIQKRRVRGDREHMRQATGNSTSDRREKPDERYSWNDDWGETERTGAAVLAAE